jgi:hypothetical protein
VYERGSLYPPREQAGRVSWSLDWTGSVNSRPTFKSISEIFMVGGSTILVQCFVDQRNPISLQAMVSQSHLG